MCVFCAQLSGNFLKAAFFKKGVHFFSHFSVLSLIFENPLFMFAKTPIIKIGVSAILCFLLLKEQKKAKQMITGISGCGFYWSKNGRFVTHMFFCK